MKPTMLMLVEQSVEQHPFTTLNELHDYIDDVIESLKVSGTRSDKVTRTAYHTRASV